MNLVWQGFEWDEHNETITIQGCRTNNYNAPTYHITFKPDDYDLKQLVEIVSKIASNRAKRALDFKEEIIDVAMKGTKYSKEGR